MTEMLSIYLDSTAFVDLCDLSSARNADANNLVDLCENLTVQGYPLRLVTGTWTVIESTAVMYGILCELDSLSKGIPLAQFHRKIARHKLPPDLNSIAEAKQRLQLLRTDLKSRVRFDEVAMEEHSGNLWRLVSLIAEETIIFPGDSIHLAMAILEGCSVFITDDERLLKKIDHSYEFLERLRRDEFSLISLPSFHGNKLDSSFVPAKFPNVSIADKIQQYLLRG